jgi:hypothetical protein
LRKDKGDLSKSTVLLSVLLLPKKAKLPFRFDKNLSEIRLTEIRVRLKLACAEEKRQNASHSHEQATPDNWIHATKAVSFPALFWCYKRVKLTQYKL